MKNAIIIALFFLQTISIGCPVCERQQPKILRGIIHGTGPDDKWDYVIVWSIAVIAILTLFFSIKWIIKPGEKNKEHIKYFIINKD